MALLKTYHAVLICCSLILTYVKNIVLLGVGVVQGLNGAGRTGMTLFLRVLHIGGVGIR